jgi:hypothetical protein
MVVCDRVKAFFCFAHFFFFFFFFFFFSKPKSFVFLVALCSCHTLLTYGPPSDFQPSGFGVFNVAARDFTDTGERLGARLLTDARVAGVLAGSFYSVVYGSFNWIGLDSASSSSSVSASSVYNLRVIDMSTGADVPLWPSVWGAGVEGACWRNEKLGSFFVAGQILGFQNVPQSKSTGVSVCSLATGCGSVSNGLSEVPDQLKFASMAFDTRSRTLFVFYMSEEPRLGNDDSLLAIYSDQSDWSYRSIFTRQRLGLKYVPRILLTQSLVWVLQDAVSQAGLLRSLFCPESNDPVPPLIFNSIAQPDQCWRKQKLLSSPSSFLSNVSFTHATSTLNSVVALTVSLSSHNLTCMLSIADQTTLDCTFNINTVRGDRMAVLSSSKDKVFVTFLGSAVEVYVLNMTVSAWQFVFEIGEFFLLFIRFEVSKKFFFFLFFFFFFFFFFFCPLFFAS